MEDEGTYRRPKRSRKPTKHARFGKDSRPDLPQELITAILVRLPVKYILQCKCVSKYWLALISSPEFVKTHLSFSSKDYTNHRLLFGEATFTPRESNLKHCSVSSLFNNESVTAAFDLDYPIYAPGIVIDIVGSANGLICLLHKIYFFIVWNPSTRKFKQVRNIRPTDTYVTDNCGFGYDEVHNDYKIVVIPPSRDGSVNANAIVYSLKSGFWRKLDDYQMGPALPLYRRGMFFNGKLHWVTIGKDIMSIDLVDEKCGIVEQPCYGEGKFGLALQVLGSDFSVLCSHYCMNYFTITDADLWVMKDYGVKESWTKLHTIKYPFCCMTILSLCMSHKREILVQRNATLMIYNLTDRSFRYPEVTDVDGRLYGGKIYIESLISPILQNE